MEHGGQVEKQKNRGCRAGVRHVPGPAKRTPRLQKLPHRPLACSRTLDSSLETPHSSSRHRGCNCKSNRPGTQTSFCWLTRYPAAIRDHHAQGGRGIPDKPERQPLLMAIFSLLFTCAHAAVAARLSQIMLHHLPFSGLKPLLRP